MLNKILEDLNLDVEEDLTLYMAGYFSFEIAGHRVTLGICKDGDTVFTVDGSCDFDNVKPIHGALILRRLQKEWHKLVPSLNVTPFCYPTETDGLFEYRVSIFQKAGFSGPAVDGKMVFKGDN